MSSKRKMLVEESSISELLCFEFLDHQALPLTELKDQTTKLFYWSSDRIDSEEREVSYCFTDNSEPHKLNVSPCCTSRENSSRKAKIGAKCLPFSSEGTRHIHHEDEQAWSQPWTPVSLRHAEVPPSKRTPSERVRPGKACLQASPILYLTPSP